MNIHADWTPRRRGAFALAGAAAGTAVLGAVLLLFHSAAPEPAIVLAAKPAQARCVEDDVDRRSGGAGDCPALPSHSPF